MTNPTEPEPLTSITALRRALDAVTDVDTTADTWPLLASADDGRIYQITDAAVVSSDIGEWVSLELHGRTHPDDDAWVPMPREHLDAVRHALQALLDTYRNPVGRSEQEATATIQAALDWATRTDL